MKTTFVASAMLAPLLLSGTTLAKTLDPLPGAATQFGPVVPPYVAPAGTPSGTWSHLTHAFPGVGPDTALLLTDGSVMMHATCSSNWYRLRPSITGSYIAGTWTVAASMPSTYKPLYFASQVLADGRMIINGGEYDVDCKPHWSKNGALFNPVTNTWTTVPAPPGWTSIGDAQSVVRTDNHYMLANALSFDLAIATISGTTVTWSVKTPATTHKADGNDEEGWSHLPNGKILTVDANRNLTGTFSSTELFTQTTNTWAAGPNTVGRMVDTASHELGPAVLLPSGLVFQFGGTSNTGIYNPATNVWVAGPLMPGGNTSADGPAAVLPNGRILVQVSPGVFQKPSSFYEVAVTSGGATFTQVTSPSTAANISSYEGRMLVLPTGQILWSSDQGEVAIYTPTPSRVVAAWQPVITSVATTLTRNTDNNLLQGKLLHGLSEGGYYGDDAQMSTNYPLVRFRNNATGHICYARTHNHSRMGVKDSAGSSTFFFIPRTCEAGASTLTVVVNGIASVAKAVTLK